MKPRSFEVPDVVGDAARACRFDGMGRSGAGGISRRRSLGRSASSPAALTSQHVVDLLARQPNLTFDACFRYTGGHEQRYEGSLFGKGGLSLGLGSLATVAGCVRLCEE
jgi:hypothetical protein